MFLLHRYTGKCNSAVIYSQILAVLVLVAENYISSQNFSVTIGLSSPETQCITSMSTLVGCDQFKLV